MGVLIAAGIVLDNTKGENLYLSFIFSLAKFFASTFLLKRNSAIANIRIGDKKK